MSNRVSWLGSYREIWLVDFEFRQPDGGLPEPHCMVAREFHIKRTIRLWKNELLSLSSPPFSVDSTTLFVAYYSSAELNCFRCLDWPIPERILDLYVEFRNFTNGCRPMHGMGLLGALLHFGFQGIEAVEKQEMRQIAIRGGPFTEQEKRDLLDYCESDVIALHKLLTAMFPKLEPQSLLRGRYMSAVSAMETTGTPIDVPVFEKLMDNWESLKLGIVQRIDPQGEVYEGMSFRRDRFEFWLKRKNIPWPRLESGNPALNNDTFRQMSKIHPAVAPFYELRHTLSDLKNLKLSIGPDGRNRCMLSPFSSKTGRNQPSNTRFIFGPSTWLRRLIKPGKDQAVAYVDYSQQEFGIAAALSGDDAMMNAYHSGDPYLAFAKQAGAVPEDATKESHKQARDQFKQCALAVQYGMSGFSLAKLLGEPEIVGRQLLQQHRETYPKFWNWTENVCNLGLLGLPLTTMFGWRLHFDPRLEQNPRSLSNFPIQANGAEILRLACCYATEQGIQVCCPIHDAVLIEAHSASIEETVMEVQKCFTKASIDVLGDFELRSDVKIVRYPDRYEDERGETMWNEVMQLLKDFEIQATFCNENPVLAF